METIETDVCIIGAGPGGLRAAETAARTGHKVVLIEKGAIGGSTSRIAASALIAAGRAARAHLAGEVFGIAASEPRIDGGRVLAHLRQTVAAAGEGPAPFDGLDVKLIPASARFIDPRTVEAGDTRVRAKRFVIATGSRPTLPVLPGLETVSCLTTDDLFDLEALPTHLIVLGGTPVGLALAQAYRRLGTLATVIEPARMLPHHERPLIQPVFDALRADGVILREGAKINSIEPLPAGVRIQIARVQGQETIDGSHILAATGRVPNVEDLGLANAGVAVTPNGITVDAHGMTSNRRVYAIGEVAGGMPLAHAAANQGERVVSNFGFRRGAHSSHDAVPEVLYTDPEFAHVGLKQADVEKTKLRFDVVTISLEETERGRAEHVGESFVKLIVGRKSRILGVSIVAPHAGELILPWAMAMAEGIGLDRLAALPVPSPSLAEHMRRAVAVARLALAQRKDGFFSRF
jgi:pyruvate/2-oxoglutarate dehydrogenase complex dihydrolipoamide dehydrogenase (E3) component